jgi:hypothetical protein
VFVVFMWVVFQLRVRDEHVPLRRCALKESSPRDVFFMVPENFRETRTGWVQTAGAGMTISRRYPTGGLPLQWRDAFS